MQGFDISTPNEKPNLPEPSSSKKWLRAVMQAAGGAISFGGGVISAAAGFWSESEQEYVNQIFKQWFQMLEDELREKGKTIFEIMARLDMHDEEVKQRIQSEEYQSLLKKVFRNWSGIDTEGKRQKMRNLLANSAATKLTSDDVIRLFIDWLATYSDFHFEVVGEIYRNPGSTRGEIWSNLGRPRVPENSADADLYRLLIHDLSTGRVIRQRRDTDAQGQFLKKRRNPAVKPFQKSNDPYMKSAFDDTEEYILTDLGRQFVHYVMNEIVPRIEAASFDDKEEKED